MGHGWPSSNFHMGIGGCTGDCWRFFMFFRQKSMGKKMPLPCWIVLKGTTCQKKIRKSPRFFWHQGLGNLGVLLGLLIAFLLVRVLVFFLGFFLFCLGNTTHHNTTTMRDHRQLFFGDVDGTKKNQMNQMTFQDTLWLFNIAMENCPFTDDFPIKTSICKGFSIAMLNNQRGISKKYPKPSETNHSFGSVALCSLWVLGLGPLGRSAAAGCFGTFGFHQLPLVSKEPSAVTPRFQRGMQKP